MPAKCLSDDRNMGGTADLSVPYIAICRGRFFMRSAMQREYAAEGAHGPRCGQDEKEARRQ